MTRFLMLCSIFFLIKSQHSQSNIRSYVAQGLMYTGALTIMFAAPHIYSQNTSAAVIGIFAGATLFFAGTYFRIC